MVTLWALYLRLYRETRPNSSRLSTPSAPCLQYNHTQHLLLINLTCVPIMIHNLLVLGGRVSRMFNFCTTFPLPCSTHDLILLLVHLFGHCNAPLSPQSWPGSQLFCPPTPPQWGVLTSSSSCFASNPPARVPSWLDSTENWPISIIAVLAFNFHFH